MRLRRAFTLIELLTVIAITAILLTIIIIPIYQSYNMTRAAQAFSDAQDKARLVTERVSRETSQAWGVRENSGFRGAITLYVPARPGNVPQFVPVTLQYLKMDLIRPAQGEPDPNLPPGSFVDPVTGRIDPTVHTPKGQPVLPVTPSNTIVRYFVGLRDPFRTYQNPYDGLLMGKSLERDNLFVLYRVEVPSRIYSRTQRKYVTNKAFFFDLDRDNDPNTNGPMFDDPEFFNPNKPYPAYSAADPDGTPDPTKAQMVQNWLAKAQILTEVSRYDMIQPVYDKNTRAVVYDQTTDPADGVLLERPRIIPLVQFKPTRVSSEPAEGMVAVRFGDETDNAAEVAPDVYRTLYGGWSNPVLRLFPSGYNQLDPNNDGYFVGRPDPATGHFTLYAYDPGPGTSDVSSGTPLFDITVYEQSIAQKRRYPFSRAILPGLSNTAIRSAFIGCYPDAPLGQIAASFPISDIGDINQTPPASDPNNLPQAFVGDELSPVADSGAGASWSGPGSQINKSFNRAWNDYPNLRPDLHRFIDLRVTPQGDNSPSPLDPDASVGFARARIVPGSEVVYGPDQNPGPHYRQPIRYQRVSRGSPGPNQYKINYVDQREPDYAAMGVPAPPATYTATDFSSAVIQPRFKAGYIQLNSDPNVPLPGDDLGTTPNEGVFQVYYRVQFTRPNDILAVDYDSRQLMSVLLTVRNYAQSSLPNAQTVTLSSSAKVRNYLR